MMEKKRHTARENICGASVSVLKFGYNNPKRGAILTSTASMEEAEKDSEMQQVSARRQSFYCS